MGPAARRDAVRDDAVRDAVRADGTPWRYAAFLSYSRAADGKLAPALQQALHRFGKPWYRQRSVRVFRDDASLSANPGLWSSIQAALDGSEFFILLASPESAASPWVAREVEYWLAHKPAHKLLIAVTDGDIVWDAARSDFDRAATTCLPPALYGALAEEPRWVDLRRARREEQLSLRTLPFRDLVADLAAPLHHRDKDDMLGEDVRQHRRTMRLARLGITALAVATVVAVGAAFVAVNQARVATEQRDAAEAQQRLATARQLVASAANAASTDPALALRLGLAAQAINDNQEARAGLVDTLLGTRFLGQALRGGGAVDAAAFSPDGSFLAVVVSDQLAVLDVREPGRTSIVDRRVVPDTLRAVAFSPDGAMIAGYGQRRVTLWRTSEGGLGEQLGSLDGGGGAAALLAFAPDGRTLAAGDEHGAVALWSVADPARPVRLAALPVDASALAFGEGMLATGLDDGTVVVWDVAEPARPRPVGSLAGGAAPVASPVEAVAFATGGTTLVTVIAGEVVVWRRPGAGTPGRLAQLGGGDPAARLVAVSADGTRLAAATDDGGVDLWDLTGAARPRRVDRWTASVGATQAIAMAPGGATLVTGDTNGGLVVWDGADRPGRSGRPLSGHDAAVRSLAFFAGGATLVSAGEDEALALWDVADPARAIPSARLADTGNEGFGAVSVAPDGTLLATGADNGTVALWDVADPARPRRLGHEPVSIGAVTSVTFAPDGRTVVAAGGRSVTVLDVRDPGRPVDADGALASSEVLAVAFSPDGATLAAAGGTGIEFWRTDDPTRLHLRDSTRWVAGAAVTSLAFAPVGHTVAAGLGERGTVVLLDVTDPSREQVLGLPLAGGAGAVGSVVFAPDARTLAVGDSLGGITLWDLADRLSPRRLGPARTAGNGGITSLAFTPAGTVLAAGGTDGTVVLLDLAEVFAVRDGATQRACAYASGGFDRDDWATYVPDLPYVATCPR